MDRTTVMLPSKLKERACAEARREGISFGAFVRRSLEHEVSSAVPKENLMKSVRATPAKRPRTGTSSPPDWKRTRSGGDAGPEKEDFSDPYDVYF